MDEDCTRVIESGLDARFDFLDEYRWFVVRMAPYASADHGVTGAVLTFTNVTAFRASVDQAVYERESTKAILNTVAEPLVVLNAEARIQSANRAFYMTFGVSREETQGAALHELGNGLFKEASFRAQLAEILSGQEPFQPLEVDEVSTPDGRRTFIVDAHPLSLPGHLERRALVTFQDITTRKQAELARDLRSEEDLRRSEASLAEAQRLSLTGTFLWKVATGEINWSEQLYRIYELEVGVPITLDLIRTRVHPDDITLLEKMIEQVQNGRNEFEWQYRLMMPDRSIKYLHAVARPTERPDGQLEYLAAVQDVTARHLSEEALAKARSELTKVARASSLGVLTASIAHEVNQPLSGILTNASTCLRMLEAEPPNIDGARETVRRTIRDGNRASDVIARLRALFSKEEFVLESLDLTEATREVLALISSDLQRNRVILQSRLADHLPLVMGDRIQLQQVILNLVRNASEAMAGVDDRPRHLLIRTERDGDDSIMLAVQDAGVGIDRDSVQQLFDPFYTTKNGGMGIGLSVSRSIIESHHGRIWATPNDGPGATFAFSIPYNARRER